jgi:DNA primase
MTNSDVENIRSSVTMAQLASMYGYTVNRSGMMRCPFHGDTHPSMKIYDGSRGFYCFVCNAGGDIYDFVMRHDGLEFPKAVERVAEMFGIPLSDGKSSLSDEERKRILQRKAEMEAKEQAKEARSRRLAEISDKIRILKSIKDRCEPLSHLWCGAEDNIVKLSYEWEKLFQEK